MNGIVYECWRDFRGQTASVSHHPGDFVLFGMRELLGKGAVLSGGSAPRKGSRRPVFCPNLSPHVPSMPANFSRDRVDVSVLCPGRAELLQPVSGLPRAPK